MMRAWGGAGITPGTGLPQSCGDVCAVSGSSSPAPGPACAPGAAGEPGVAGEAGVPGEPGVPGRACRAPDSSSRAGQGAASSAAGVLYWAIRSRHAASSSLASPAIALAHPLSLRPGAAVGTDELQAARVYLVRIIVQRRHVVAIPELADGQLPGGQRGPQNLQAGRAHHVVVGAAVDQYRLGHIAKPLPGDLPQLGQRGGRRARYTVVGEFV